MKKIKLIAMVAVLVLTMGVLASCIAEVEIDLEKVQDISKEESIAEESSGFADPEDLPGHVKAPAVTEVINITASRICIAGTCEKGATVTIYGGKEDVEVYSENGYFIVETELESSGTKLMEAVATKESLEDSASRYFYAQYKATVSERVDGNSVLIGKNSQLFLNSTLPDFFGENLYTNTQLNALKEKVNANYQLMQDAKLKMLERTREEELVNEFGGRALTEEEIETLVKPWAQANFKPIPYIFVIAPNALTVYPELAPDSVVSKTNTTRYKQVIKALKDPNATVIDLSEVFAEHKDDEYPIYSSTNSYWTEYGAYLAYKEIMDIVDDDYPAAAARPLSDFNIEKKEYLGGNMVGYLYIDREVIKEEGVKLVPKFTTNFKLNVYKDNNSLDLATEPDANKTVASTTRRLIDRKLDESYPNGYILRDEWSAQMFTLLADRFSATIFHTAGAYDPRAIDINYSSETARPDYTIVIFNESNIENVFKLNAE